MTQLACGFLKPFSLEQIKTPNKPVILSPALWCVPRLQMAARTHKCSPLTSEGSVSYPFSGDGQPSNKGRKINTFSDARKVGEINKINKT